MNVVAYLQRQRIRKDVVDTKTAEKVYEHAKVLGNKIRE